MTWPGVPVTVQQLYSVRKIEHPRNLNSCFLLTQSTHSLDIKQTLLFHLHEQHMAMAVLAMTIHRHAGLLLSQAIFSVHSCMARASLHQITRPHACVT